MIEKGTFSGGVNAPLLGGIASGFELLQGEENFAFGNFPERNHDYICQAVEKLVKDFVELIIPSELDRCHTTTSLSAARMPQFDQLFGLEITLPLFKLLEDLLVRSRGVGADCLCKPPARSPFSSAVGFTFGDSVVSQSLYSLPNVTSLTVDSGSEASTNLRHLSIIEIGNFQGVATVSTSDAEDVRLAVLVHEMRLLKVGGSKKLWIRVQCHAREDPVRFLIVLKMKPVKSQTLLQFP